MYTHASVAGDNTVRRRRYGNTNKLQKQNIVAALDAVSALLGNTRTVCKKYYVHPQVISLYESKSLDKYLKQLDKIEKDDGKSGLAAEEKVLMGILKG